MFSISGNSEEPPSHERRSRPPGSCKGLVAVVTGGNSGLGLAIAELFLSKRIRVATISRHPERLPSDLRKRYGDSLLGIRANVVSEEDVREAFVKIRERFGGEISILVNNAGDPGPVKPLQKISIKEWEETIGANLTGAFLCSREALPFLLRAASFGNNACAIVNVSSMASKRRTALRSPYSASKLALVGLTRSLSAELAPSRITVNAVSPGPIEGSRLEKMIEKYSRARKEPVSKIRENMQKLSPSLRFARPFEIASFVYFLTTNQASFITGQDFDLG